MEAKDMFDEMFDLKPSPPPFSRISDQGSRSSDPKFISFESSDDHNLDLVHDKAGDYSEIINFSSSSPPYKDESGDSGNRAGVTSRSPSQAQEHVIAERKRRENLSQLFISLSKVVPGLKKLDKASLLEDGINYLKSLEERVSALEEEEMTMMNKTKSTSVASKHNPPPGPPPPSGADRVVSGPEIEARISEKNVLIKVLCKKEMEFIMSRIGVEIEKIHLNVTDIRIMPFGLTALHTTILAQMQSEFKGTVKDIVNHLNTVFSS